MAEATTTACGARTQPAVEVLRRPRPRALAATAAVALSVLLVCNVAAGWLLGAFPQNRGYQVIRGKWLLLDGLTAPVDTLILGDSGCLTGIDPRAVEAGFGGSAVNLCTVGDMTVVGTYWMLERYVARFGPPQTVIVGHVLNIWPRSLSPVVVEQLPVSDPYSGLYAATLGFRLQDYLLSLVARFLPMVAENRSLAEMLTAPWHADRRRVGLAAGGFMDGVESDPRRVLEDADNYRRFVRRSGLEVSDGNRIAFQRMAQLARRHGFEIFFVHGPLYEGLIADARIEEHIDTINAFLHHVGGESGSIRNVFARPMLFSENDMENADHVSTAAAAVYTREIVAAVSAMRRAPFTGR